MDAKLLTKILGNEAFESKRKGQHTVKANQSVTVLLSTQTVTAISKVKSLEVTDGLTTLKTNESTYFVPTEHVFALKIEDAGAPPSSRTGFLS